MTVSAYRGSHTDGAHATGIWTASAFPALNIPRARQEVVNRRSFPTTRGTLPPAGLVLLSAAAPRHLTVIRPTRIRNEASTLGASFPGTAAVSLG